MFGVTVNNEIDKAYELYREIRSNRDDRRSQVEQAFRDEIGVWKTPKRYSLIEDEIENTI